MNKVLEVILKLTDQFTGPLRQSESGLKGFGSELKTFALQAVTLGGIGAALNKAWNEADELTRSMQRVEGTAKIVNVPLSVVKDTAATAAKTFGLSATSANNFAASAVTMAAKAGAAGKATELMAATLNLAAARGISADDALKALNITLKGQDEGLDKLVQRNPSAYYLEWANAAGKSVGKLTDVEKSLAIVDGLIRDAGPVHDAYTKWLETVDGKAFLAGQSVQDATAKFGVATATLRTQMISAKAFGADLLTGVVEFFQKLGVNLALSWDRAVAGFSIGIGEIQQALGAFIAGNRLVLMVLGDTATEIGNRMQDAGTKRKIQAYKQLGELTRIQKEMYAEIEGAAVIAERNVAAEAAASAAARVASVKGAGKAIKAETMTAKEIQAEAARQTAAAWGFAYDYVEKQTERIIKLAPKTAKVQKAALAVIIDGLDGVYGSGTNAAVALEKMDHNTANAARGAISLAKEFGVIDDNAANVLGNVVNLADTLKNMSGKASAGDIVSIIGSAVGILNGLFNGNPAHMALIRKNSDALVALTRSNGLLLRAQSTGAQVEAIKRALPSLESIAGVKGEGGVGKTRFNAFRSILESLGLTVSDAEQMAKDMGGFDLGIAGGAMSQAGLTAFIDAIKTANFGQFGQGFGDQQDFLSRYFDVAGITDPATQAAMIADKLGKDSPFLANLVKGFDLGSEEGRKGLRAAFTDILSQLNAGTFSTGNFGGLTGAEFADFIGSFTELISGIGTGFGAGAPGGGTTGTGVTGASFSAVTFAAGSYDLDVSLFAPVGRMDVNLGSIREGMDNAVAILRESMTYHATTAAATMAMAESIAAGAMATTVGVQTADSLALTGFNSGRV